MLLVVMGMVLVVAPPNLTPKIIILTETGMIGGVRHIIVIAQPPPMMLFRSRGYSYNNTCDY